MKKKTMRAVFVSLLIIGFIAGFLIPWDFRDVQEKMSQKKLQPDVFEVGKKFGQLDQGNEFFKYTTLVASDTASIDLLRIDTEIPNHVHEQENHYVYIFKGKAKIAIGDKIIEVGQGQLVVLPAGVPHKVTRVGDTPVEAIVFAEPHFVKEDIKWVNSTA